MKRIRQTLTLEELARQLDLPFTGEPSLKLTHACGLDQMRPGGVAYLASASGLSSVPTPRGIHRKQHHEEEISGDEIAVIVPAGTNAGGRNFLFAHDPLAAHVKATALLHPQQHPEGQVHPQRPWAKMFGLEKMYGLARKWCFMMGFELDQAALYMLVVF